MSEVRESLSVYGATVRKLTVREYHRASDKGVFQPQERLELIEGQVIQRMSPQRTPHAVSVQLAEQELRRAFPQACIRCQFPLQIDQYNEPEPDVAVVRGQTRDYASHHPGPNDVLLVVEVSDTTLEFDRGKKAEVYARHGIPELWVVNLAKRCVEVMRDPIVENGVGVFRSQEIFTATATIAPLSASDVPIAIADLLP